MPETLGEMVESCALGCHACSVLSLCTCQSRTVGILEIAGIQTPIRGLLSGARTFCSIPSGKSQCVEGGVIFTAWWSRQCAFKLSILSLNSSFFVLFGFESTQLARRVQPKCTQHTSSLLPVSNLIFRKNSQKIARNQFESYPPDLIHH